MALAKLQLLWNGWRHGRGDCSSPSWALAVFLELNGEAAVSGRLNARPDLTDGAIKYLKTQHRPPEAAAPDHVKS